MTAAPPPGWYPDNLSNGQRYWDGRSWTERTRPPATPSGPTAPPPSSVRLLSAAGPSPSTWLVRHKVLSIVAACILLIGIVATVGSLAGEDDEAISTASGPALIDTSASEASIEESLPVDSDGDGVADEDDFAPQDPEVRTEDDVDSDNDGVSDGADARPSDPKVQTLDDIDSDKDGVANYKDDFPHNPAYSKDADGDTVPDQLDDFPKDDRYSKDSDGDRRADSVDAFPSDPGRWKITLAMDNALAAARDYLDYSAFSRQGLIDQLSSPYGSDFELADAAWAVGQLSVDWKQQAVLAAKEYLEYSPFSRQGLIDQLSSAYGSQFTVDEAVYAVNKLGL